MSYAGFNTTYTEADLDRLRAWRRSAVAAREGLLSVKDHDRTWAKAEAAYWMRTQRGATAVLDYLEGRTPACRVAPEIEPHVRQARAFLGGDTL